MRNVVSPAHGDIGRAGEPMRVAVYYSNSDIRVEERPVPSIGPGEVLVKTEACGLCGGEAMEWYLMPGPRRSWDMSRPASSSKSARV